MTTEWAAGGKLPDDEAELVALVKKLYKKSKDARAEWETRARESYDFYNGKQYTPQQARIMEAKGTPPLTINRIFPQIRDKLSLSMRGLPEIKCYPRESADVPPSNAMNELLKFIQYENDSSIVEDRVILDALISGIGWEKVIFEDQASEDVPDIQLLHRSPFVMYPDPDATRVDLEDADYVIEASRVSLRKLYRMFPEAQHKIFPSGTFDPKMSPALEVDIQEDDYGSHGMGIITRIKPEEDKDDTLLLECWIREYAPGATFYDPQSEEYVVVDIGKGGVPIGVAPDILARMVHIKNHKTQIRLIHIAGSIVLQNEISPYIHGRFPYVPLFCYVSESEDSPYIFGEVDNAKEPQQLHNKFFSLALHNLATATNFLWLMRKGAVDTGKLEASGSTPGAVIEVNVMPGEPLEAAVKREAGIPIPNQIVALEEQLKYEIERITGVFQSQRGELPSGTSSGRQLSLQIQQGQTAVDGIVRYSRAFRKNVGRLLVSLIQQFWRAKEIVRVVGNEGMPKTIYISQELKDLAVGKFDIIVGDTTGQPSSVLEKFAMVMDLFAAGIVPPQIVLDYVPLDLNKEEIKAWLKQKQILQAQATMTQGIPDNKPAPATKGRNNG